MLSSQAETSFGAGAFEPDAEGRFERHVRFIRTSVIVAIGLFVGCVLGGVCGLFAYVNSRNPHEHDAAYIVIQVLGIAAGLALGYLAARRVEAQEKLVEASRAAGMALLSRYRAKPGTGGDTSVGQRTIGGSNEGEEFLRSLLAGKVG